MKERPILFSAPMVRALLDGSKTQTRRVVKPQPEWTEPATVWQQGDGHSGPGWYAHNEDYPDEGALFYRSPYGQPGNRLWVRETWCHQWDDFTGYQEEKFFYRASTPDVQHVDGAERSPWKPSIHMPRAASRITLEITGVRVERLQHISEADARAEGARNLDVASGRETLDPYSRQGSCVAHYKHIWQEINGHGSWDLNPLVWVIEFKKVPA
jgi:hypothetical protein